MNIVIVDTTGIQPYIFGSHRLRENIGASWLVSQATSDWAFTALRQAVPTNNLEANENTLIENLHIEAGTIDGETVYSGGGNFVALFRRAPNAESFIRILSKRVLCEAPGLNLVAAREEFDWSENLQNEVWPRAFQKLTDAKRAYVPSAPLLGLSVIQICRSSGLPAAGTVPKGIDTYPAAADTLAKLAVSKRDGPADRRLYDLIGKPGDGYDYPSEFDDLGRSRGEFSYIAVVHADGNDMGDRFQQIQASGNRDYLQKLRTLSSAVDGAARDAMKSVLSTLKGRVKTEDGKLVISHPENLPELTLILPEGEQKQKVCLPFRPLVFGGDDATFVCDGRLGVSAAVAYLEAFENAAKELPGGPGNACAGVAIVKSHYPFGRAYELADELCRNAKEFRREKNVTGGCLDWHLAQSGLAGGIEAIRAREYKDTSQRSLNLRPVALFREPGLDLRAWPIVKSGLEAFQRGEWREKRNKLKALREVLREGETAVGWFLQKYGGELPELDPGYTALTKKGWHSRQCGYFDAIELMDRYMPL